MIEIVHSVIMTIIVRLVIRIATLVTSAAVIPTAERIVMAGTRLCTWGLGADVRERRLREMQSELFEQRQADFAAGLPNEQIAKHILARWMRGILDELSWRWEVRRLPQLPLEEKSKPPIVPPVADFQVDAQFIPGQYPPATVPALLIDDGGHSRMMGWVARRRYEEEQRSRWMAAVAAQRMAAWGDEVIPVAGSITPTAMKTDVTSRTLRLGLHSQMNRR
jgi:hypothetical protein